MSTSTNQRHGARPVRSLQAGAVPGPLASKGPTQATGGPSQPSCGARGCESITTGRPTLRKFIKERPLNIMHWNAEGVNSKKDGYSKKLELENTLFEEKVDVCCMQETHLSQDVPFKIRGYQCFRSDRQDRRKGGILTLVRNTINACQVQVHMEGAEYQVMHLKTDRTDVHLLNYYCPNDQPLMLDTVKWKERMMVCGDFNSHSQSWGYDHMDKRGEELENWQDEHGLLLINHPKDPPTFYSRSWHTTSTPDVAFYSPDLEWNIVRKVGKQLGGSDHRPVFITVDNELISTGSTLPRWNFKKADWSMYKHRTSVLAGEISTEGKDINKIVAEFTGCILQAAKETIPRGARRNYKPYWTKTLDKFQEEVEAARQLAEESPSQENHNKYQHAKAKFQRAKLEDRRKSWREKTAKLNFEKDGRKLWRLVNQLNDQGSKRGSKTTLLVDGKTLTGKQTADFFAQVFSKDCDVDVSREKQQHLRQDEAEREESRSHAEVMDKPITPSELSYAISQLKLRKSPGQDGVANEMIKNLGTKARNKLLEIFNISWEKGEVPQIWREATMVPILKTGKDSACASNYRPISLTSCLCKTMERIVNHRMKWYLESEKLLAPQQAGFRQCYSTEDQATYLSQDIEDAFQDKKLVLAAWIDLRKAFDKVWKEGLLWKMRNFNIQGNMYRWTKSYLHNRKARVQMDGCESKKVLLRHGVPQGGVLSPTLFLIFINDLISELPHGIKTALYADDLVMWCVEESAVVASKRLQIAVNSLANWTDKWCITVNKEKSSTTLFTLSPKQKAATIRLDGAPLKEDNQPTYLGVTFDPKLSWKDHILRAETKARRKLAILRKLSGTTWGANEDILKNVYQQGIRPHLEYGSTAWCSASKSALQTLDRVQNQALRLITGGMKSTPITEMEKVTGIQPLQDRRDTKVMIQGEKFVCSQNHPMQEKFSDPAKGRLKRSSFIHKAKRLRRQLDLPGTSSPVSSVPAYTPWKENSLAHVDIRTEVKNVESGKQQSDVLRRTASLCLIEEEYPQESWIRVYTDGSAENAVSNGGAGATIEFPDHSKENISIPTGRHCNNYKSEVQAIIAATEQLLATGNSDYQIVFLTDAKAVLEALKMSKLTDLQETLAKLGTRHRIVLQWIPSHCGIPGNETADTLAKRGSEAEQPDNPLSFSEKRSLIKAYTRPQPQTRDDYHLLSRADQVTIFRLRTGHNRLRSHLYSKFKVGASPECDCGQGPQDAEHILQWCPNFNTLRQTHWPRCTDMKQKLYGSLQDLQLTVRFVGETKLQV